ncbi:YidH family protein [Streptomyces sp. NPDC004435]|uniref:YidH family protein n=1 Tax=Streptomyces sp. NPDC004435 TaxID=3364701 RepID=UPI0036AE9B2E
MSAGRPGRPVGDWAQTVRLSFTPRRIRDEGETPDYRFSLANERTFLAWIRTALALIGGGFAIDQFLPDLDGTVRAALALATIATGALCAVRAVHHWVRCEQAIRRGEDLPATAFPALLAGLVTVVSVAMVAVVAQGSA